MELISTLKELQYDGDTGELVIREGKDCRCIGLTTTVNRPDLVHIINLPRPVDIMITQVFEYSYGDDDKPQLIIPEKIHYTGNSVEVTFSEKILATVRFNIMYVCGYEYDSLGVEPSVTPTTTVTPTPTSTVTPTVTPPITVTPTITPTVTPPVTPTVTPTVSPIPADPAFKFEITINDDIFTMPTPQYLWDGTTVNVCNYTVDWGDGSSPELITSWNTSHDYTGYDGIALISLTGQMDCWRWGDYSPSIDGALVTNFLNWGDVGLIEFIECFSGCSNMDYNAIDVPVFNTVPTSYSTDVTDMFLSTLLPTSDLSGWDVSSLEVFYDMFAYVPATTLGIGGWNVGSGVDFGSMFFGATNFNEDIGSWNMTSAGNMTSMMYNTVAFDQDISAWTPTAATQMHNFMGSTVGFSTANYDLLLNAWSLLTFDNNSFNFHASTTYTIATSQAARDILTGAPNNWNLTDAGGV